jgi:hypothetical protein
MSNAKSNCFDLCDFRITYTELQPSTETPVISRDDGFIILSNILTILIFTF